MRWGAAHGTAADAPSRTSLWRFQREPLLHEMKHANAPKMATLQRDSRSHITQCLGDGAERRAVRTAVLVRMELELIAAASTTDTATAAS